MVASPPLGSSALFTDEQQTPPPPKTAVSPPPISTLNTSLSAPLLAAVQTGEMGAAAEAFALLRTKLAGAPPSIAKSLVCARTAAPDCPSHIAERAFRGDTKQEANLELSCANAHTRIAPTAPPTHWPDLCARYPSLSLMLADEQLADWAATEGLEKLALLQEDTSPLALVRTTLQLLGASRVEARLVPGAGRALFTTTPTRAAEVLLHVPLAACITAAHSTRLRAHLHEKDTFGLLVAALLELALTPADPRARYFLALQPPHSFEGHIAAWPPHGTAARIAAGCVAALRAASYREDMEQQVAAFHECGFDVSVEQMLWATLVVQTRALVHPDAGHVLMPGLDIANHATHGSARVRCSSEGVSLVAEYSLDAGEEVTWNYDHNADFIDLFERYAFFDGTSEVHTAEVVVAPRLLASQPEWRRALVDAEASRGCDRSLHAWWVPDTAVERCPLFAAARACFVGEEELHGAEAEAVLRAPIVQEAKARELVVALLRQQVERIDEAAASVTAGVAAARAAECSAEANARRLVHFERSLLLAQVEAILAWPPTH